MEQVNLLIHSYYIYDINSLLLEIVIVLAPDEAAKNQIIIKNMKNGEQTIVDTNDLQNAVNNILKK